MKTPAELMEETERALARMDAPIDEIRDLSSLVCVLLTAPDIEEVPGLHRLMLAINDGARKISAERKMAAQAIHRLANP